MKIKLIKIGNKYISQFGFSIRKSSISEEYWLDVGDCPAYMTFTEEYFKKWLKINEIEVIELKNE